MLSIEGRRLQTVDAHYIAPISIHAIYEESDGNSHLYSYYKSFGSKQKEILRNWMICREKKPRSVAQSEVMLVTCCLLDVRRQLP